jgi:hypothetical protein
LCFEGIADILTTNKQRPIFTDQKILELETKITAWAGKWIALTGREGMTNYTHVIISAHLIPKCLYPIIYHHRN